MNTLAERLEQNLKTHLTKFVPHDGLYEVYHYSLIPAGKLFRPLLAVKAFEHFEGPEKTQKEVNDPMSPLSLNASAVEIHHTYTLIHDDLPAMDDDSQRRGRASSHIQFNEWKALLAGDGLHGLSYQLVLKSRHPNTLLSARLMAHCLGAKGLIEGQNLDLSGEMTKSFSLLKRTHLLKTARLIQYSLLSGALLSEKVSYREVLELAKLGERIGLTFQFIDDLSELAGPLSRHESQVNPWINFPAQSLNFTQKLLERSKESIARYPSLERVFADYAQKMGDIFTLHQNQLLKNIAEIPELMPSDVHRLIALFELLSLKEKSN